MLASLPFAPELCLPALDHLLTVYSDTIVGDKLPSSINPTLRAAGHSTWVSGHYFGLDQGIVVLMIENYLSGLIWKLMRNCAHIPSGLKCAGFSGGWLS